MIFGIQNVYTSEKKTESFQDGTFAILIATILLIIWVLVLNEICDIKY